MTIVGTFDTVFARVAPIVYPMCALAVIMRFEKIEEGQKSIRVSFIDSDGRSIMPTLNTQITVNCGQTESHATVHFALVIQQISLPNFGEYSIDLAVDGRQEASTPLYVRQIQPPQGMQLPPHAAET